MCSQNPPERINDIIPTIPELLNIIEKKPQESSREWLFWMFESRKKEQQRKTQTILATNNHPIEIWQLKVFEQKLSYIHNNPMEAGFVTDTIDWKYSSARNCGDNDQTIIEIDLN